VSEAPAHRPGGLTEAELGHDPIARLVAWLDEARIAGVRFPEAAALATADADGRPAVRHVLVKVVDERGLTFFTNRESRKGRQLAVNPNAGLAFYWRELDRQVCVTGRTSLADDAESDAYFRTRPREARIGAWASRQSRPVGSRDELEAAFAEIAARFPGDDVPLPPHWDGYRIEPETIEFWKGREHRLHDRFRFTRDFTRDDAAWRLQRLWP
jgi:pyridoxamine 5'-phosphate oxidase